MRILFVSIAFPPKNDPECFQTAKIYKYLVKQKDFYLDVLTSSLPTLFMPYDASMEKYDRGYFQKIQLRIFENKYVNFLLRRINFPWIERPDSKFGFHLQWRKVISKLNNNPDIIYSRSFPLSSSIAAYKLSNHYKVPWILHLSDPWTISPIHSYNKKNKKWNEEWEMKCFTKASAISLTSEVIIDLYKKKYPQFRAKFFHQPNVYDPDNIAEHLKFNDTLTFVYTGGLAGNRTAIFLIETLIKYFQDHPTRSLNFQFILAGPIDRMNKAYLNKISVPYIHYLGALSKKEATDLQRMAHVLWVLDTPTEDSEAVFFPSKLLDYLVTKKRIAAITSINSPTAKFLDRLEMNHVQHSDEHALFKLLDEIIHFYITDAKSYFINNNILQNYSAKNNADILASKFLELNAR